MALITVMTEAQEREMVVFREEMRALGVRTGHDAECEEIGRAAIDAAYETLSLPAPKLVLWAQSPLQAVLMAWTLKNLPARDGQLEGQLGGQLGSQLGSQLGGQLRSQLEGQLGSQLYGQLRSQLDRLLNNRWMWGQTEICWLAVYRWATKIGVVLPAELEHRHSDIDVRGLPRRLLRIHQEGDHDLWAIEYTNHSVEPDGTRKVYTTYCDADLRPLAIPGVRRVAGEPQPLTCHNALASTYGYYGRDYHPNAES